MQTIRIAFLAMILAGFGSAAGGCLAVAAAAGAGAGVAYYMGELRATVDGSPEDVINAAEAALNDMNITVVSATSDALEGELIGRTAQDRRIRIRAKRETGASSEVGIRIGTFGDEKMSHTIYDRLRDRLE